MAPPARYQLGRFRDGARERTVSNVLLVETAALKWSSWSWMGRWAGFIAAMTVWKFGFDGMVFSQQWAAGIPEGN